MPSYEGKLTDKQLDALVQYLLGELARRTAAARSAPAVRQRARCSDGTARAAPRRGLQGGRQRIAPSSSGRRRAAASARPRQLAGEPAPPRRRPPPRAGGRRPSPRASGRARRSRPGARRPARPGRARRRRRGGCRARSGSRRRQHLGLGGAALRVVAEAGGHERRLAARGARAPAAAGRRARRPPPRTARKVSPRSGSCTTPDGHAVLVLQRHAHAPRPGTRRGSSRSRRAGRRSSGGRSRPRCASPPRPAGRRRGARPPAARGSPARPRGRRRTPGRCGWTSCRAPRRAAEVGQQHLAGARGPPARRASRSAFRGPPAAAGRARRSRPRHRHVDQEAEGLLLAAERVQHGDLRAGTACCTRRST